MDPPSDSRGVISLEGTAEIRRLHRYEVMPIPAVARRPWSPAEHGAASIRFRRAVAVSAAVEGHGGGAVQPELRELLAEWPTMPVHVNAERIGSEAWRCSRRGAGVAAVASAAGSGVENGVSARCALRGSALVPAVGEGRQVELGRGPVEGAEGVVFGGGDVVDRAGFHG